MRHAQQEEADADEDAKADVEKGDGQQVTADALRGLADGLRGHGEVRAAGQPQHLVADLLALLEQEEDEHDDQERGEDELDRRRQRLVLLGHVAFVVDDADFEVRTLGAVGGRLGHALQRLLDHRERAGRGRAPQEAQLLLDLAAGHRVGHFLRHRVDLLIDPPSAQAQHAQRERHRQHDGRGAAEERALQHRDDGREEEGEEDGQGQRHHHRLGQVEHGNDDEGDEEDADVRLPPV